MCVLASLSKLLYHSRKFVHGPIKTSKTINCGPIRVRETSLN